jgi:hypothetical protein
MKNTTWLILAATCLHSPLAFADALRRLRSSTTGQATITVAPDRRS